MTLDEIIARNRRDAELLERIRGHAELPRLLISLGLVGLSDLNRAELLALVIKLLGGDK